MSKLSESIPLVPIDLTKTPMPWKDEFERATHPSLLSMAAVKREVDALFYGSYCHVAKISHWIIKLRFDSKHKLPKLPKGQKGAYKPLSELYTVVIDICQECHFLGYGKQYNNAAQWFIEVLAENALDSPNVDESKDSDIRQIQSQNKTLFSATPKNPFSATEESSTYELIEAAISIANQSDIFCRKTWRRLKETRLGWLAEYRKEHWRSPRCILEINDENGSPKLGKNGFPVVKKVFIQVGRGGNQSKILPPLKWGL